MRIIVLGGCGAMGSEATRDLAQTSDFEEIVIADVDLRRAQALAAELGGGRLRAMQANAEDEVALTEKLRGFDVIANCTTYHFGMNVMRAAIAARVNYLDLGGLFNTPRQLQLDELARNAGVTACLGCGATPGVTNLMARYAADQLERVDEVHIAFASFRSIAPSPGLLDLYSTNLVPAVDASSGRRDSSSKCSLSQGRSMSASRILSARLRFITCRIPKHTRFIAL